MSFRSAVFGYGDLLLDAHVAAKTPSIHFDYTPSHSFLIGSIWSQLVLRMPFITSRLDDYNAFYVSAYTSEDSLET